MITDPNVNQLRIKQEHISIFASGFSIEKITPEEYAEIRKSSFVIGTNYFFLKYLPHLLIWSDIRISKLLHNTYSDHPDFLLMTRAEAYERGNEKIQDKLQVDYWFNKLTYNLEGNFTFFFVLQMIKKFFPEKKILMFGVDFDIPQEHKENNYLKYYDNLTNHDFNERNHNKYITESMKRFKKWMERWVDKVPERSHNIFNCNLESKLDLFEKQSWKEVVHEDTRLG